MWVRSEPKTGKVRYCEQYTDPLTGKKHTVTVTYMKDNQRNRKDATQELQQKIQAKLHRKVASPVTCKTLRELCDLYLEKKKSTLKQSTLYRNTFAMDGICAILGGDTLVSNLSSEYVRDAFYEADKKPQTINEYIKRFKTMIRWAFKSDNIDNTACIDKLDTLPDDTRKKKLENKYLESGDLKKLLDGMNEPIWKCVTEFLVLSGLRFGELVALDRADIEENVIHINKNYDPNNEVVTTVKTIASNDDIHIQPELKACIERIDELMRKRRLIYGCKSDLFVFDKDGKYISYCAFNKYLKENSTSLIGRPVTTHVLRHTHASLLFQAGASLEMVSRRLRHANSKVTKDIYIHVTEQLRKKDAEKLDSISLL